MSLRCPECGFDESAVKDSRPSHRLGIRRRRECTHCGERFTTYEMTADQFELSARVGLIRTLSDLRERADNMLRALGASHEDSGAGFEHANGLGLRGDRRDAAARADTAAEDGHELGPPG